jgi:hypothetical protein
MTDINCREYLPTLSPCIPLPLNKGKGGRNRKEGLAPLFLLLPLSLKGEGDIGGEVNK